MWFNTNLAATNWLAGPSVVMTNLLQNVPVDQTARQIFYRVR
jgi:hypothetical protein